MRTIIRPFARKSARRREKTRVATHDDIDFHPAERPIVEVVALDGARDKARSRTEARCMVAAPEIVIDRLRDVPADKRISLLLRLIRDDARGISGVVAADIVEIADIQLLERLEDLAAVVRRRFQPAAAERRGWRRGNRLELLRAHLAEVDVIPLQDAGDAVPRAENLIDRLRSLLCECRRNRAPKRLVDHH